MFSWLAKVRQTICSSKIAKFFGENFFSDDLLYFAASLSFYTIFALVPILLISITIMANLPSFENYFGDIKHQFLANIIPSQAEILMNYMDSILKNGLQIGLIGIFYILMTSILFFNNYEYIVSKIFQKPKKSFFRALTTYWTLMTLTPIFMTLILVLTSAAQENLSTIFTYIPISFSSFVSFLLTWLMFFILMKASINFAMDFKAVAKSSLMTAILWFIAQKLFLAYIFANTTYKSLYGSFSSVLFFFLWIYISWVIYLFGLKSTALMQSSRVKDSQPSPLEEQDKSQI